MYPIDYLWGCFTQAEPVTDPRNLSSVLVPRNLPQKGGKIEIWLTITDIRLNKTKSSYMKQNPSYSFNRTFLKFV